MAAALAFYRRLGLDIPAEADSEPHVDADLGGFRLMFDTARRSGPSRLDPALGRARDGARVRGSPAEVDATYAELTGAGADGHLEPWDAYWGMRYAVVHDPDATRSTCSRRSPASAASRGSPARPASSPRPAAHRGGTRHG